jgi:hypothetical protein
VHPAIRPSLKVYRLTAVQFDSGELFRLPFVLDSLLSIPPDGERAGRPGDEVPVFPRALYRIENDFQLFSDGDTNQGGLGAIIGANCTQDAKFAFD